ncbi:MAG: hypothetical protein LBT00_08870 [Spirochaetaceae bacterium]|jgi:hypothetical protein|nr:hypothetical protein [Spirochaetaceae bacterium]
MKKNGFRGIAALVFALGIIAVGFTGCDFLEDFVRMQGGDQPTVFFSGTLGKEDSAIDKIWAAKDEDTVSLTLKKGVETEMVELGQEDKDLLAVGLVLNSDNSPANVTIDGNGREVTLTGTNTSNAPLITVGDGVTLTLTNITFKGMAANTASLIRVNTGGTLYMESGTWLTGNKSQNGGGVYVDTGGTLYMESGADLTDNKSDGGGGVYVRGTFNMNGGTIRNNEVANGDGGGVYVDTGGTLIMESGAYLTDNKSGGGVYVYKGTFNMNDGTISRNKAAYTTGASQSNKGHDGGVYVGNGTTFIMKKGTISDNETDNSKSSGHGGGVHVLMSTFEMKNGIISGNKTGPSGKGSGGGVYSGSSTFKKTGGTIYGQEATEALKNRSGNGNNYGHAVCTINGIRDSTAGEYDDLDSTNSTKGPGPDGGGWE